MDRSFYPSFGGPPGAPPWAGTGAGARPGQGGQGIFRFGQQDTSAAVSPERQERLKRVQPYMDLLKSNQIPQVPREELQQILKDLKEEGNTVFKEKDYFSAGEYYTCALIVGKMLQEHHYVIVPRELLSTLFCNRAACCLKVDNFKTGIEDCDLALSMNEDNVKAYYRKASALKMLKLHGGALDVAEEGLQRAVRLDKTLEVKEFTEMIREIKSHLPENAPRPAKAATAPAAAMPKTAPQVSAQVKPKAKTATASIAQPSAGATGKKPPPGVDASWLLGTNALNAQMTGNKPAEQKTKDKNKAKNKQGKKQSSGKPPGSSATKYTGKFAYLQNVLDSSSSSSSSADSEEEQLVPIEQQKTIPAGARWGDIAEQESNEEETDNEYEESDEEDEDQEAEPLTAPFCKAPVAVRNGASPRSTTKSASPRSTPRKTKNAEGFNEQMGLDDFNVPANRQPPPSLPKQVPLPQVTKPVQRYPGPARLSQPQQVPAAAFVPQKQPQSVAPPAIRQNAAPAPATNFTPIRPPKTPPEIFVTTYDYCLACSLCFNQVSPGAEGIQARPGLVHRCGLDILLVRYKGDTEYDWMDVRVRPHWVKFQGRYKHCQQYLHGLPCKVAVDRCSFLHNEGEEDLWPLDRDGEVLIREFIDSTRRLVEDQKRLQQRVASQVQKPAFAPGPPLPPRLQPSQQPPPPRQVVPLALDGGARSSVSGSNLAPAPGYAAPGYGAPGYGAPGYGAPGYAGQPAQPRNQAPAPPVLQHVQKMSFPLARTHTFKLVCSTCLRPTLDPGLFQWLKVAHSCLEDTLAVQVLHDHVWVKVRERRNHRNFLGSYKMCMSTMTSPPQPCKIGDDGCSFSHNPEEQQLWTMEKDQQFDIREFILQNRTEGSTQSTAAELFKNNPGEMCFLCRGCFFGQPMRLSKQRNDQADICSAGYHTWSVNRLLVHFNLRGQITPIEQRPFTHSTAFFLPCHHERFCVRRRRTMCRFYHSLVERDVWLVERDSEITREEMVEQSRVYAQQLRRRTPAEATGQPQQQPQQQAAAPPAPAPAPASAPAPANCPYRVIHVCALCWKQGNKCVRDGKKDRCTGKGMGHTWAINTACLLVPVNKIIRPLPRRLPTNCNFIICRHVREKGKCDYNLGGFCQFAHSKEEVAVWTWMVTNKVVQLEDLVELSYKTHVQTQTKPIAQGQSVVAARPLPAPLVAPRPKFMTPADLTQSLFFCHYCSISCNSQKQWDQHCSSDLHMFNVNSDKEHQWNYRQPPWGVPGGNYELCFRHSEGNKCKFSSVPDMYNLCKFAHGREELDEWKERWEWRQMKREIAKQEQVYSYMDMLLEEYEDTESGINVISEELEGVTIECPSNTSLYLQDKKSAQSWIFTVKVHGKRLEKVALLHNKDRLHFCLVHEELEPSCQVAPGDTFQESDLLTSPPYTVEVKFKGGMFGSFSQWVIFDFGVRPVMVQKLSVELGTHFVQEKVKKLRERLAFDRWTGDNREIVKFYNQSSSTSEMNTFVIKHYKAPSSSDAVITQQSVGVELNRHNYMHKMHKLLQIEELTRHQIISSYNLKTEVQVLDSIQEEGALGGMIFAQRGELFARVPLDGQLSEDTDAGKLILSSVYSVLLAPQYSGSKVYEAVIVHKENYGYDGRGRDYIYVCLGPTCCQELNIESGESIAIEIQFQMNRLPFCQMHYAVDQLEDNDIVFPDLSKLNPAWSEKHVMQLQSRVLNDDQMRIVEYIVAERQGYSPPYIIYGPFGTGKTETLAQATMLLVKEKPSVRILICTHSNSAADLYITKHFDNFTRSSGCSMRLLRVYHEDRRVNTVNPVVQKYCKLTQDCTPSFIMPTLEEAIHYQVVIATCNTSLALCRLGMKGRFTHIFIDEAAQTLECEAIMPLSLANDNTCVVMAGDHIQMSPKVYSREARNQRFHRSLLERLYRHYDTYQHMNNNRPLNILLRMNYRSKMELLRFLSAVFYGGPDKLVDRSNQPMVATVVPLTFYAAQGRETQDSDSTSYYNVAEVEEVVDRVEEVFLAWPEEWGERQASAIGVVTPYSDQVQRIRQCLRRRRKELRDVTVERVMNVQGKEFRALFLSTVRTRHLAENPPKPLGELAECDGDGGDYGFLSDQKLLNTALSRAQSMVAVVGDAVALCAIGECMNIWRTFLKHCENLESIFPSTVTLASVKSHVVELMNSPLGQNLVRLAASTQEAINTKSKMKEQDSAAQAKAAVSGAPATLDLINQPNAWKQGGDSNPDEAESGLFDFAVGKGGFFENWSMDYRIEPDDIIKQLAKEALKAVRRQASGGKTPAPPAAGSTDDEPLKVECIRVKEQQGHMVVSYSSEKPRNLLGADDFERQYDSDDDASDEEASSLNMYSKEYTHQQLQDLLRTQPTKYYHCILHIESSQRMFAQVIDPKSAVKDLKISSRQRCGHNFNGDEVVVEMLSVDEEDAKALSEEEVQVIQGTVVGTLRRSLNPRYRMFVCMVEQGNTGLMVPLNRGIPKIFNLETKTRLQRTKKGHVCVYTFTKHQDILFHHYEPIDPCDPMAKLFIVRYLKWDPKFYCPLGIVVGVLPVGATIDSGMDILNIEHYIPKGFKKTTVSEVEKLYPMTFVLPMTEYEQRLDYRGKLTFTIDPEGAVDLDDALSIESLPGNQFLIGVHIADVSYFVKRGSYVDSEAHQRGTSYYPMGRDAYTMLPERLSSDLCSLKPDVDRLTLSVFITINGQGQVMKVQPKRCIIQSKEKMSYTEAEDIINYKVRDISNDLLMAMLRLYNLAKMWRKRRLGNAYLYLPMDPESADSPQAHLMVEEIMITANHHVALLLQERYGNCVPLRQQLAPNEQELQQWKIRNLEVARHSVVLTKPFLPPDKVCDCSALCTCLPNPVPGKPMLPTVDITSLALEQLREALAQQESSDVQRLVIGPEYHPRVAVAMLELRALQERGQYVRSGETPANQHKHHSLNVGAYTHFTSPIRRYMDLAVHRMLVTLMQSQPNPYSQQDVTTLCNHCTEIASKASRYENATRSLQLSVLLQERPAVLHPVVEKVDQHHLQLRFPATQEISPARGRVTLNLLKLSEKPAAPADQQVLKWQKRIYDPQPDTDVVITSKQADVRLDPRKYVADIPLSPWLELLGAVLLNDKSAVLKHAAVVSKLASMESGHQYAWDVTSEGRNFKSDSHFCSFGLAVQSASVLKVQVTSDLYKGLITPRIQLLSLTPSLDICLEHYSTPVQCFASFTTLQASKTSYKDVASFQASWLPVMAIEAAASAISSNASAIIHNISIKWVEQTSPVVGLVYVGVFQLSLKFCKDRHLRFNGYMATSDDDDEEEDIVSDSGNSFDYMCVRYPNLAMLQPGAPAQAHNFELEPDEPVSWVGHCLGTHITKNKERGTLTVQMKLHQSNVPIPQLLLRETSLGRMATVEWIPKTLPDSRMEKSVRYLQGASSLAVDIALGKNPAPLDPSYVNLANAIKKVEVPTLATPNQSQDFVVHQALTQPFTLIQGPPGTGKTVTGVRLAYLFYKLNQLLPRKGGMRPQVMYCGPSNKSVDVVAGYLKQLGDNCPRLVRVYSETIERKEFPLPGESPDMHKTTGSYTAMDKDLQDVALHHRIRRASTEHGPHITQLDHRIQASPDGITAEEIQDYLERLGTAQVAELRAADIILCTCTASSSPKIRRSTYVQQLIVDECGMCTQPESMVPIVSSRASQVVLIGDHRQLRPIVLEETARNLGLEKSLFERYSDKAKMLTVQYRMHEGIAAFPSEHFYGGMLSCGREEQTRPSTLKLWPSGRNMPVVFVHVVGLEDTQTVATADGSEQSKSNQLEAVQAVRAATLLSWRYHCRAKDVVVMSQYRAQCAEIERQLASKGENDIAVSTVVASQGSEWDYVILSTVRSLPKAEIERYPTKGWRRRNLGFITDEHQINVAITRARKGLIIIGNKNLLEVDLMWHRLLRHYNNHGKIVDAADFMPAK